jgi:polyribonucleotide nucleotidyltransferase
VVDFGAFVNFFGSKDGLVHISQLAPHKVAQVKDVVNEGDTVKVKVLGFDDRGKVKLSMKVVDQETGEDLTEKLAAERAARGEAPEAEGGEREDRGPRRDRGDRGGRDRGPRRERRERTDEPVES